MTRLPSLGHAWRMSDRMKLRVIRLASGREPSDILKLLFYRRDFFGDPFTTWVEAVLRGPSDWTVGEREMIAAFISNLNQCRFCTSSHGAVAALEIDAATIAAVQADWRTAPIGEPVRAALALAERLTLTPEKVGAEDIEPLRAAGCSAEAITDVVHICGIFNTINRIADAVDFAVPDEEGQAASARVLLKRGYALG
jgi:uncharacterized peroxidase-related enzyme